MICSVCWKDNCKSVCEEDFAQAEAKIADLEKSLAERDMILTSMNEAAIAEGNRVGELNKSLAESQAREAGLREALEELREAVKAEPVMNNMKYDALGIKVNKALSSPGVDLKKVREILEEPIKNHWCIVQPNLLEIIYKALAILQGKP